MSSQPTRAKVLRICAWGALLGLLVTAIVPVLFFRFPGPKFIPLRYEWMWAITELLWEPLRFLQIGLDPLVTYDLRQHVNRNLLAPIVNAPVAFITVYVFLKLRARWQRRSRQADGGPELQLVVDHIEGIRTDYPAALHTVPHPVEHSEAVMQEARAKLAGQSYFQPQVEPEPWGEDDKDK
jgi:hypothetical protein